VKVENILHVRNNITCSTDCVYRTAATPYTLQTWFVGYIIVNTIRIGDKNDNNNNNNNNLQQQQQQKKSVTAL
jgi:hypothetical protein